MDEDRTPSKLRVALVIAAVCACATGAWTLFLASIGRLHAATHGCYDNGGCLPAPIAYVVGPGVLLGVGAIFVWAWVWPMRSRFQRRR